MGRAGATTLAELTVFHKPAILVPYPYAADNHQEINGRLLVDAGAGRMFRQEDLTGEKLGLEIEKIITDRELMEKMAANSGRIARPEATEIIVNACMDFLKEKPVGATLKILAF